MVACKIPLLALALGLKAEQPLGQARAMIGYLVYKHVSKGILHTTCIQIIHYHYQIQNVKIRVSILGIFQV